MNKLKTALFLLTTVYAFNIKAQEVIQSAGQIVLPATSGGTKTVSSGQTLTATSNTGIVLNPGFSALAGSTVILKIGTSTIYPVPPANNNINPELNWVISRGFDENGNVISEGKSFFDLSGKGLQSQSKSMTTGHVLASQSLDDLFGRTAISTLSAPINSSDFVYKPAFVSSAANVTYNTTNFDGASKLNNPDPVDQSTPGTLGWYYSNNNTWDAYVPATAYPYSRTDFFKDGTDAASRGAGVGDQLKMGMGHEAFSNNFPVVNELSHYLSIRNRFFTDANIMGATGQTELSGSSIQTIGRDAQGNWGMTIKDKDGKTLMSALPGTWLTVNNTITLNNYKEEFDINGSTLNLPLTALKINGAGQFLIYDNNSQVYQGLITGYSLPTTIASTETYRILSDQPFTVQYASVASTVQTPVCENCHSQIQSGSVKGQDYHYFALPQGGNLGVSGGAIQLVDLVTNATLYNNQNSQVTLPAGMYKAIAQSGQPQLSYTTSWGDISYSFYDQKGQGIASIAPNGIQQICTNGINAYADLAHLPFTNTVEYNKQGQLMASTSTDGGRSEFSYRRDGMIRFSQNAVQRNIDVVTNNIKNTAFTEKFSYTNYDDSGRPIESGEYVVPTGTSVMFAGLKANSGIQESLATNGGLTGGTAQDWVRTHYDLPDNSHGQGGYIQDYLDGAVSWTENANAKTWYSYDEQGKVTWIIKYINGLGYKTTDYTYDYLGNVTTIAYQKNNNNESFYHHYAYDADQRLVNVQTSRDGTNKLQQANYQYYLHGPIKRVELGDQVQGIDYVYTAQGMLKSINYAGGNPSKDPGHDGQNSFAPDAFGMQMEYFNGDYGRANTNIGSVTSTGQQNYYNGNLNAIGWQSNKPQSVLAANGSTAIQNPAMYNYSYDNKSQLTGATWGTPDYTNLNFTPQTKFSEKNLSYDANGNIQGLQRTKGDGTLGDDFSNYQYQAGTNKLNSVGNASSSQVYATYTYDDLGQLKSMQRTGESFTYYLKYDVTGKITGIYADASLTQLKIGYGYDESGNRVSRTVNTGGSPITSYYVYDASGNSVAIYNGTTLAEIPFYGSDRLGTFTLASNNYVYELRDNVGSVRVVVNRNKKSDGSADVINYDDYYPFGSIAQGGGTGYKYDYQGAYAEKDPVTGFNNFELRMYDGKIGRWLSTDPAGQYTSPYEGMGNNPVIGTDPDGAFSWWYTLWHSGTFEKATDSKHQDSPYYLINGTGNELTRVFKNPEDNTPNWFQRTVGSFGNLFQGHRPEYGNPLTCEGCYLPALDAYKGPKAKITGPSIDVSPLWQFVSVSAPFRAPFNLTFAKAIIKGYDSGVDATTVLGYYEKAIDGNDPMTPKPVQLYPMSKYVIDDKRKDTILSTMWDKRPHSYGDGASVLFYGPGNKLTTSTHN